jgi:glycosyltransferase involved in cell wall biosynthesis
MQTYPHWELVVAVGPGIDDAIGSMRDLAERDPRIKVVSLPADTGTAARLNYAARAAKGDLIAYLNDGAEFNPDFLERVAPIPGKFGVAIFGCDVIVPDTNGAPTIVAWNPVTIRDQLFVRNIAVRFGIVHSRELFDRAGGLNELLVCGFEWDLLRRFARMGAEFTFPAIKAGRCRAQVEAANAASPAVEAEVARVGAVTDGQNIAGSTSDSHEHGAKALTTMPTDWQLALIHKNRLVRKPVFGVSSGWMRPRRVEAVLFVCAECVLDYTNGASLAVLHALCWLNSNGFTASAFCICEHADRDTAHAQFFRSPEFTSAHETQADNEVQQTIAAGIPVTLLNVERNDPRRLTGDARKFLDVYERVLANLRPDVVVTYGGDSLSLKMMEATKLHDIPIVFWLHNFSYPDRNSFQFADRVIVPSDFSREYHWQSLGLDCCTIPNLIDWQRVQVQRRTPRYVTFVNPGTYKGVFVFAAIAERLASVRPDIPLLVVEGRTSPASLKSLGIDLATFANVKHMTPTADPREFYSVTKLVVMPSLWNESFGLVAAEAMINGIPVLASNRGALPEIIGNGGDLFDIPERYTPDTRAVPTAGEIQPWVDRIINLWDDPVAYVEAGQRAHARAQTWRPDRIGPLYRSFFAGISPQPAPPIVFSS